MNKIDEFLSKLSKEEQDALLNKLSDKATSTPIEEEVLDGKWVYFDKKNNNKELAKEIVKSYYVFPLKIILYGTLILTSFFYGIAHLAGIFELFLRYLYK